MPLFVQFPLIREEKQRGEGDEPDSAAGYEDCDERRALQGVRGDLLISFLVDQVLDPVDVVSWVCSGRAKPA